MDQIYTQLTTLIHCKHGSKCINAAVWLHGIYGRIMCFLLLQKCVFASLTTRVLCCSPVSLWLSCCSSLCSALEMISGNRCMLSNHNMAKRTELKSTCISKKGLQRSQCLWKRTVLFVRSSFDCISYTWMSWGGRHLDDEDITKQQQPLLCLGWQPSVTDIKMSPIHVMDLARPGVAGLRPSTPLCHPITLF